MTNQSEIQILKVQEVKGFIHEFSIYSGDANRYNANRNISRSYDSKALKIECLLNGKVIVFYSPTVVITETSGLLNMKHMKENDWFFLKEGESTIHRGLAMFDGGNTPNFAIDFHNKIVPKINVGDILKIKFSEKGNSINRVKILK